jgi:lactose/L-arabinose transport system permease protein
MSETAIAGATQPRSRRASRFGRSLWQEIVRARWAYVFVAPFFIFFALFSLYPVAFSVYLSFTEWKGLGPITFIGLTNYQKLLNDTIFWQSMGNGVILFFMYVPPMTLLALVLAVILNSQRVRGFRIFRTIIFMPYITNMVAAGFAFRLLLNKTDGFVNQMLGLIGIAPIPWLETPGGARVSLCLLIVWAWLGYNMVLMLAGLQTISSDLTEAAQIDGASNVQAFWYVTVPLMRPVLTFSVVLSTMGSFALFTEVSILTNGGQPMNSTITPIIAIFNQAFVNFRLGYASAMSYVYFAVIFVLTLFQMRYLSRNEESEENA